MSSPQKLPDKPLTPRHAWQPFTPRGVAAFATAAFTRLFLVQLIVAAIVAVALIWFLRVAWFPVIAEASEQLPETGVIRRGELTYGGDSPTRLAGNTRLGIVVDVLETRAAGQVADLEITFEKNRVIARGPLGMWSQPYDRNYVIGFNRPQVEPAWGAWRWLVVAGLALATVIVLFITWWCVGLLYLPIVKLIAFFTDRVITWRGAWRVSTAALLPGSCLVAAALTLYGFGAIDLFRFGLLYLLHLLVGLSFVCTSSLFLSKLSATTKNPFGSSNEAKKASGSKPPNPFAGSGD